MKPITHGLLPLVFPLLSFAAAYFIFHQSLLQNGLQFKISAICNPGPDPHPYRLPYTGIAHADDVLCGMVVFYHALIDPAYAPLLAVLFPALGVVAFIPFLEAARDRHPFVLRMPTLIGVLFQLASMGVVMPMYCFLFVTVSIRPSATSPATISQGDAEALLFGLLAGYVLPTALMLRLVRPSVTAVWQGFPLLIALAISAHARVRPARPRRSGHPTVVAALACAALFSAVSHAVYVWPVLGTPFRFLPTLDASDPATTAVADGVVQFIRWDVVFGLGAIELATLWMADGFLGLVGILVWYGVANVAIGPAAAIAGVFLWRERRLEEKALRKTE